jgi:hypothetical protein
MAATRPLVAAHLCSSVFICGFLAFAAESQAQQLYKCTLANGRVQYQQEPCLDAAKQSTVRPPDPIAPKSEAEQKAASDKSSATAELQMSQVIVVLAGASICSGDSAWDAKYSDAVQAWKSRNGAQVAKFDSDQDARAKALAFIESERARFAGANGKAAQATYCEGVGARLGAPAAPPAAAAKK